LSGIDEGFETGELDLGQPHLMNTLCVRIRKLGGVV
jgi:hypothetical protein